MLHDPTEQRLFPTLPPETIEQLRAHATEVQLQDGDVLFGESETDYDFWVILDGAVRVTKRVGTTDTLLTIHHAGEFTGEISMLTDTPAIATGRAEGTVRALRVKKAEFKQLVGENAALAKVIFGAMVGRTQDVAAQLRQQEKLAALGKLSAGLAHELNNPAAAARRAAQALRDELASLPLQALAHDERFAPPQRQALAALLAELLAQPPTIALAPLAQSDREDELAQWLDDHGIADGWDVAPALVGAGLDPARLAPLTKQFQDAALGNAIGWLHTTLNLRGISAEVEGATRRISELVGAMKAYTYMDRAEQQQVDIHQGIEDTLTILQHKLKHGVSVTREYDRSLPPICAYGSELNQVWTNLLDNALDAMGGKGHVWIRTLRDRDGVRVEIADDGPGIPPALVDRIWEPFFTTKGVGEGTGLGLDIVLRIVCRRHNGDIKVHSAPGHTCFEVWLPIDGPKAQAEPNKQQATGANDDDSRAN